MQCLEYVGVFKKQSCYRTVAKRMQGIDINAAEFFATPPHTKHSYQLLGKSKVINYILPCAVQSTTFNINPKSSNIAQSYKRIPTYTEVYV